MTDAVTQPRAVNEPFALGNKLKVTVIKAEGLLAADPWGTSDPYCCVSLGRQQLTTNTVLKTLNPVWNQHLEFPIRDPSVRKLTFALWDSDLHSDNDPLGQCELDVSQLEVGQPLAATLPVQLKFTHDKPQTKGQLWVSVAVIVNTLKKMPDVDEVSPVASDSGLEEPSADDGEKGSHKRLVEEDDVETPAEKRTKSSEPFAEGNKLKVTVIKAQGLLAADPWGTSDPYCSVSLGRQRLTTDTVLRTLDPVWNQHLVFPIRDPAMRQLTFALWDSDLHNDNDPLGRCELDISKLEVGHPLAATLPVQLKFTHDKSQTKGQLWVSVAVEQS